jgi:protein SCO1/2
MRRSLLLLVAVLMALAAVAAVGSWWLLERAQPPQGGLERSESSQTVSIGGPFELTAHTGARMSDRDFRGRWLLLFFGYTYCPDVCPTTLGTVAVVMDELGALAEQVQPLFVTVDPERDTPEVLAEYVAQFHPSIVGLTGTPEEIAAVAKAWRVFYRKVVPEGGNAADYLMDHSAYLYLIDPNGNFLRVFSHTQSPEEIASALLELIGGTG